MAWFLQSDEVFSKENENESLEEPVDVRNEPQQGNHPPSSEFEFSFSFSFEKTSSVTVQVNNGRFYQRAMPSRAMRLLSLSQSQYALAIQVLFSFGIEEDFKMHLQVSSSQKRIKMRAQVRTQKIEELIA